MNHELEMQVQWALKMAVKNGVLLGVRVETSDFSLWGTEVVLNDPMPGCRVAILVPRYGFNEQNGSMEADPNGELFLSTGGRGAMAVCAMEAVHKAFHALGPVLDACSAHRFLVPTPAVDAMIAAYTKQAQDLRTLHGELSEIHRKYA